MCQQQFMKLMVERQIETNVPHDLFAIYTFLLCSEPTAKHCHRRLVIEHLDTWIPKLDIERITMKIVINYLTRMQKGFMCVVGIDLDTHRHVRPVLRTQMRIDVLASHGEVFGIVAIVDLGRTRSVGSPPAS